MQYLIGNGPAQGATGFAKVATGTAIKTMLQVKTTLPMRIVEWGCSFDASAAATPGIVELIETNTVFGTVTAAVAADITLLDGDALLFGDPTAATIGPFVVGTTSTGYTCTSEGSVLTTNFRNLAGPQLIAPTNQFIEQFPLGYRPLIQAAKAMRIRMTFGVTVGAYCYVILEV